jgi:hypothetical protein
VAVVCSSWKSRSAWDRAGVPEGSSQTIRPGVLPARSAGGRDAKLRTALGFGDMDHVLLAVGESSLAARHHQTVWAASILHVIDANYKLLLWRRGATCDAAVRLAIGGGSSTLSTIAEARLGRNVEFEQLLPAADMALITADRLVPPLPIASCMAARVPIVATPSPLINEMLKDRETALIAPANVPRRIAQTIEDLQNSSQLQQTLAERAAVVAGESYGNARFIERHQSLYAQFVGGRIPTADCATATVPAV